MTNFAIGSPSPMGTFFTIILVVLLIATWVILATSRFTQGGIVERPERVPQLYGYTVCLIALAIAIVNVTGTLALFAAHWRWVRRLGGGALTTPST